MSTSDDDQQRIDDFVPEPLQYQIGSIAFTGDMVVIDFAEGHQVKLPVAGLFKQLQLNPERLSQSIEILVYEIQDAACQIINRVMPELRA